MPSVLRFKRAGLKSITRFAARRATSGTFGRQNTCWDSRDRAGFSTTPPLSAAVDNRDVLAVADRCHRQHARRAGRWRCDVFLYQRLFLKIRTTGTGVDLNPPPAARWRLYLRTGIAMVQRICRLWHLGHTNGGRSHQAQHCSMPRCIGEAGHWASAAECGGSPEKRCRCANVQTLDLNVACNNFAMADPEE